MSDSKPGPMPRAGGTSGFVVVGVGASAGGIEALRLLVAGLSANDDLAIVVVTHQAEGRESLLAELLAECGTMPVEAATDGVRVAAGMAYVAQPGKDLELDNGHLRLRDRSSNAVPPLPIDHFFRTLARDQGHACAGVVLSGSGSDGSVGIREIAAHSGLTLAQNPASAKFPHMPARAIATGVVDFVLAPQDMPARLVAHAASLRRTVGAADDLEELLRLPILQRIYGLIRTRTGHDFSTYKATTIRRRIERRMRLHQVGDPAQYLDILAQHDDEVELLGKELLISVTSFFRDPDAFAALRQALLPMLSAKPEGEAVRVWVVACSTGEEAYSISILLRECMAEIDRRLDVQIFATDLDDDAIAIARAGKYPAGIAAEIGADRLRRFFTPCDDNLEVCKEVRESIVFATHDVLCDPPFPRLDLISCRNLLIYLEAPAQREVLPLFHFALRPEGLLLLGGSESIGTAIDLFAPADAKHRIYRCIPGVATPRRFARGPDPRPAGGRRRIEVGAKVTASRLASIIDRVLLNRFAPPSVVVDEVGEIVHVHGHTGKWLELSAGQPKQNVVAMAREGLRFELASSLRAAVAGDEPIIHRNAVVQTDEQRARVDVSIVRLGRTEPLRTLFLITFDEQTAVLGVEPAESVGASGGDDAASILEHELQITRETLQATIEELETANEELTSTNEELQSTNEELQSTNEEMETSREELQSVNEELQTVNAELQIGLDGLARANDDMTNLLNSIEIATVFLDNELRIKRFTASATKAFRLIPADVGRPIADIVSNLDYAQLVDDAGAVLRTLAAKEVDVKSRHGRYFLLRLLPYRTANNLIDGLVITIVDVDRLRRAQRDSHRLSTVIKNFDDAVIVQSLDGKILAWSRGAEILYGYSEQQAVGMSVLGLVPPGGDGEFRELCHRAAIGKVTSPVRTQRVTIAGERRQVELKLTVLTDDHGRPEAFSTIERPVADREPGAS